MNTNTQATVQAIVEHNRARVVWDGRTADETLAALALALDEAIARGVGLDGDEAGAEQAPPSAERAPVTGASAERAPTVRAPSAGLVRASYGEGAARDAGARDSEIRASARNQMRINCNAGMRETRAQF